MTVATVLGHKNINRADTDTGNTYILNSNETAATKETLEKNKYEKDNDTGSQHFTVAGNPESKRNGS